MERGPIEVAPLSYMRAALESPRSHRRTSKNRRPTMKMFPARLGSESKVVVTVDAPNRPCRRGRCRSGPMQLRGVLDAYPDSCFFELVVGGRTSFGTHRAGHVDAYERHQNDPRTTTR